MKTGYIYNEITDAPFKWNFTLKGVFAKNERGYRLNVFVYSLYFIIFFN